MRLRKSQFLMLTMLAVAMVVTATPATAQTNASTTSPQNPQSGAAVQSTNLPAAKSDDLMNRNPADISLEKQVTALFAHKAEFQNVKISVSDAVVTLDGSVPTKIERRQAKALARSVNGVKKVQERLTLSGGGVSGPGTMATTPETAQNQPNGIGTNPDATSTDDAAGDQATESERPTAGGGTTGAILSVAPPSSTVGTGVLMTAPVARPTTPQAQSANFGLSRVDPSGLASKINAALKRDPALANKNVSVNVSDTGVEVTGAVDTGKEKLTAMRIAQSYAGNFKVLDRLTLAGHAPPSTNAQQTPQQANQINSGAPPPNFAGNQVLPSGTAKNAPARGTKNDSEKTSNPR
jgi:osmotically-inducible protein OsmY